MSRKITGKRGHVTRVRSQTNSTRVSLRSERKAGTRKSQKNDENQH